MSAAATRDRAHELDGIRGWASLAVVVFHLVCVVFGAQLPQVRGNPFWFAWVNGPLAVYVFFVLSGDALSIGYLRSHDRAVLDSLAVRRYFRLMVPVALSTLIVYALMRAGWVFNREAGAIATFYGWLRGVLDFPPSALGFLRYVLVEVYTPSVVYTPPPAIYNPMLWTMSVELAGSTLVFLFWYLSPGLARPRTLLAVAVAGLAVLGSFYALFLLGVLLSQWRADGRLERWRGDRRWQFLAPCLALAAATGHAVLEEQSRGYRHASLAAAAVLVGCCYTSRPLLALFRSRLSRWLGNVSFPLYLTHFAVIVSFTSWCVVATTPLTPTKAWAIAAASLAVALLVAAVFRPVERIALRAVDARLLRLLHRPSPDAPKITLKST